MGQLVAEYDDTEQEGAGGTSYLTADSLGTPRIITGTDINDSKGGVNARHDYLPFGEEVGLVGARTVNQGYVSDDVRQKFTSKERDSETGLDYFIARYYSSAQGRFTSPDSFGGSVLSPQTLNLYSYVQNNPLRFVDPTGHMAEDILKENEPVKHKLIEVETPWCICQEPSRPTTTTTTRPPAPEGYEWTKGGELVRRGGEAIIEETVTTTAKRGFFRRALGFFGKIGKFFRGPAGVFLDEMINPSQTVGGGDDSVPILEDNLLKTFEMDANGRYTTPEHLKQDEVFFRVFGGPSKMKGRFFTATPYTSARAAKRELALRFGNTAESIVTVVVPQGTLVYRGRAATQDPKALYPGQGSQVIIPDAVTNTGIKWGTPTALGP